MRRITLGVLVFVLASAVLANAACVGDGAFTTETRDDSFTVNGLAVLVVSSENGKVEVVTGSDNEVRVQATLRGVERIDYDVTQDGNTITVVADVHSGWNVGNRGADIVITAPASTDVDLTSSNGMVSVEGIEGNGKLATSNGMVSLEDVKGDFEGTTSNGKIQINNKYNVNIISVISKFLCQSLLLAIPNGKPIAKPIICPIYETLPANPI